MDLIKLKTAEETICAIAFISFVASGISIEWRNCFLFTKFVYPQFSMELFQVRRHRHLNKVSIYLEHLSALVTKMNWRGFKCNQSTCAHFLFIDLWKHLYSFIASEVKLNLICWKPHRLPALEWYFIKFDMHMFEEKTLELK